jgi:putative ABC transport system permease protein
MSATGTIAGRLPRRGRETPATRRPRVPASRMHPTDLVSIGLVGLRSRRLRAMLTAIGIAIGIAAMVAVLVISESSRADLLTSLDRLGTNLLTVRPGSNFGGDSVTMSADAPAMIERIGPVESVSWVGGVDATVRRTDQIPEEQTGGISVQAVDLDLLDTVRGSVAKGTFLNEATSHYAAVVLGSTAAQRLGIDQAGVNVWLGDHWFTVVGILDPFELASNLDATAMIGAPVAADLFDHDGTASIIYVRADADAVTEVRSVLARTASPESPNEAQVARPSDALEARAEAATAFTALFVGLGAVALIVGGVGIANVMLMSVLERRSEIGLRRALGATRRHITIQFVAEALILASLGGVLGVGLGVAVGVGYALSQAWTPIVPAVAVVGGLLAALAIGAVAGLYPSIRAARVSPTDALRGV